MLHLLIDILRNAVLITGLVIVMMMMIESLNIESKGKLFNGLRKTKVGQVIFGAVLGSIPGCMGGFATVSLYTHRMFSFGALVAMMIASSGDEAFVMLAMIPDQALILFAILFCIAVVVGIATDFVKDRIHNRHCHKHSHEECGVVTECQAGYKIHEEETHKAEGKPARHFGWKRIVLLAGLAVFITALATGQLGHDHSAHSGECEHCHCEHEAHAHTGHTEPSLHIDLLSEDWMNVLFAALSVIVLIVLVFASDHFVEDHMWNHIVKKHLPTIFAWTFGVLLVIGIGLQYIDINHWISDNTALMILIAALVGIIPESGPHLVFVTLFAAGVVPFPVLLASCISQDGHASIPLLAESKKSFAYAKLLNLLVALAAGYAAMLFM
ncbi:MAG: arsenic efflux protein [Bacteroidales bacterium]|nr:arsenic efflux protein [Bacteroidales bacterium]